MPCLYASGPNCQQKPGKVPTAAHMGPSTTGISYTATQAFQPSNPPPTHLNTPLQVPTTHTGKGHILFLISIQCLGLILPQTPPKHPKSPYKLQPLQQHHLGKLSLFYLLV